MLLYKCPIFQAMSILKVLNRIWHFVSIFIVLFSKGKFEFGACLAGFHTSTKPPVLVETMESKVKFFMTAPA